MSCRSKQAVVQGESRSDSLCQESSLRQGSSLLMQTTTEVQPEAADTAMLTLTVQSLLDLPDSAVFRRQGGRLAVEAWHKGGTVYIRGSTLPAGREVRQTTLTARHTSAAQESKTVRNARKASKAKASGPAAIYRPLPQLIGTLALLGMLAFAGVGIFRWYNKKTKT